MKDSKRKPIVVTDRYLRGLESRESIWFRGTIKALENRSIRLENENRALKKATKKVRKSQEKS